MRGDLQDQIIDYLVNELNNELNGAERKVRFIKSKQLAKRLELKPKAVGAVLGIISKSDIQLEHEGIRQKLRIQPFSYSKSTTWKVELELEPLGD